MAGVAYFVVFRDSAREYRWRFVATNGETLAVSSEGYKTEADCRHAIALVKGDAPDAPVI